MKKCLFIITMLYSLNVLAAVPQTINYQGVLTNSAGVPVSDSVNMVVRLFDSVSGGTQLWSSSFNNVPVEDGVFSLSLGSNTALPADIFATNTVWLEIEVGGEVQTPRQFLNAVPYALVSATAENAVALNGQSANSIITAASDEVRTPISSVPFTITAPGSYYLTGNMTLATGAAITISSSNVTLDLMGFTLQGGGSASDNRGVYTPYSTTNNYNNIKILNGAITGFGSAGIYLDNYLSKNVLIENIHSSHNGAGDSGGGYGIWSGASSTRVIGCSSSENANRGIKVGTGSLVKDNTVHSNGYYGIDAAQGVRVVDNAVYSNDNIGILTLNGATVTGNSVVNNKGSGIRVGSSSTVVSNSVTLSEEYGIYASSGATINNNTVGYNNASDNSLLGAIRIYAQSQVFDNVLHGNYRNGIVVFNINNTVRDNHVVGRSGVVACIDFSSTSNVAIGNTTASCTTGIAGGLPASRLRDNIDL